MAKKPKWDVLRLLKQIKAGVDRPGYIAARRSELIESIEKHLASPTLDSLLKAALNLDGLGLVEGVKGVVGVWQGEVEGWPVLQTSFAYLSWNVRIYTGLFQHGRLQRGFNFASPQNMAARCLAHAVATKEDVFADWCGRMMLDNFTSGEGLYDRWFRPFEPFMVHLFARWKKLPAPHCALPCPLLGVYQELLDAWGDGEGFAAAVVKACEYHAEHSIDGRIAHAEFVRDPHNVFPAEILAVKRVRDEEGLPWPTVDHPLLNTPLAHLPPSLSSIHNDLLDRVAGAVRSLMPEVVLPQGPFGS
jgi:hypothetical protein